MARTTKETTQAVTTETQNRNADALANFGMDASVGKDVQLFRKWFLPKAGQAPLLCLPLMRSGDVREQFPTKRPDGSENTDPAHIWALMVIGDVSPQDQNVFVNKGKEATDATPGEVVYMFENKQLSEALRQACAERRPVEIDASTGKIPIDHSRFGKVFAWQWKVRKYGTATNQLMKLVDQTSLSLPSVDEKIALLTAGERTAIQSVAAATVIDAPAG